MLKLNKFSMVMLLFVEDKDLLTDIVFCCICKVNFVLYFFVNIVYRRGGIYVLYCYRGLWILSGLLVWVHWFFL